MATLAQLQAEPWWGNEVEPTTLDNLMDRLCVRYGVPRYNAGAKGNEFHLYGRHRSIEWSLNSAYCTDRSYGTVDGRDRRGNPRHIRAFDLKLSAAQLYAMCRRLDTAVRAGRLPKVAEWFGSFDGVNVVGWYEGHPSSSDDSHLWHLHLGLWTENADDDHTDLYEILTGDDMFEEQDRIRLQNIERVATNADLTTWLLAKLEDTISGPKAPDGKSYPYENKLGKALKALAERPLVESAPVDPAVVAAAVKAALSDPDVLAAVAKAVNDDHARRQQA